MEPGGGWAARRWFLQVRIHSGYFCEDGLQAVAENAAVRPNFNCFIFNPGESFLVKMPGSVLKKVHRVRVRSVQGEIKAVGLTGLFWAVT